MFHNFDIVNFIWFFVPPRDPPWVLVEIDDLSEDETSLTHALSDDGAWMLSVELSVLSTLALTWWGASMWEHRCHLAACMWMLWPGSWLRVSIPWNMKVLVSLKIHKSVFRGTCAATWVKCQIQNTGWMCIMEQMRSTDRFHQWQVARMQSCQLNRSLGKRSLETIPRQSAKQTWLCSGTPKQSPGNRRCQLNFYRNCWCHCDLLAMIKCRIVVYAKRATPRRGANIWRHSNHAHLAVMLHLHFSSLMSSACVVCVVFQLRGKQTYSDFSLCLRISLSVFVFFSQFSYFCLSIRIFSQCSYYIFFLCICIFRPVFVFLSPSSYFSLCLRISLSVFICLSLSSSFWTENWIRCFVWSDVGFSSAYQTITKCAMILAFIFLCCA